MGEIVEFPDAKDLKEKIKTLRVSLEDLLIEIVHPPMWVYQPRSIGAELPYE